MAEQRLIVDNILGNILVREHVRARRMTFRTKQDGVYATVPPNTPNVAVMDAIEKLRSRLLKARERVSNTQIDLNYKIDAEYFKLTVVSGERNHFLSRSDLGVMEIVAPSHADFSAPELQKWLRKVVLEALKRNAKIVLPSRLSMLANRYGLTYKCVKINSSQGRWGSCSASGNINLSCYLMLLPAHLIDYVLLHELTHTREMNHGTRFWKLLNEMTEGRAEHLRNELKAYRTDF